jgi:hypothetical protein
MATELRMIIIKMNVSKWDPVTSCMKHFLRGESIGMNPSDFLVYVVGITVVDTLSTGCTVVDLMLPVEYHIKLKRMIIRFRLFENI